MKRLIIKNVNFSYGKKSVLKDISISLNNGIIGLLGPNGAGKTTLMKILSTLIQSKNSDIELMGINYKDVSKIRENIGYLPQNFETYKQVTGREFLEFIYDIKAVNDSKKEHVDKIIKMVDLDRFIDYKIKTYSGGVKRRLGIAQALIGNPSLIIIDEPTVGLDPEQRNEFRKILPEISKDKIIIISTHIVEDIEFCCNNLVILKSGEIKYIGEAEGLINKYKSKVWQEIVDENNFKLIKKKYKILDFKVLKNKYEVRFVSEEAFSINSICIKPTLEEAYLCFIDGEKNEAYLNI